MSAKKNTAKAAPKERIAHVDPDQFERLIDRLESRVFDALKGYAGRNGGWTNIPHILDTLGAMAIDLHVLRMTIGHGEERAARQVTP